MSEEKKGGHKFVVGTLIGAVIAAIAFLPIAIVWDAIMAPVNGLIATVNGIKEALTITVEVPGQACNVALSPLQPGTAAATDDWLTAVEKDAEGNNRLVLVMLVSGELQSGSNPAYQSTGRYGIYGILNPGSAENLLIKPADALNAALATNYMVSNYRNAMQTIDPNDWKKNPMKTAAQVAYAANAPPNRYTTEQIKSAYDKAVSKMKQKGISTDFKTAPAVSDESVAMAGINPKNVPEALRSWFIKAGQKYKVSPAAVAALYLTEQNGFTPYYKYADDGYHMSTFTAISRDDDMWHLSYFTKFGGIWPNQGTFQGPFQFSPATWESYKDDGNGDGKMDPYNFQDSVFAAAKYFAALGGTTDKGVAGIKQAAESYNGQISWSPGGSTIRNPDPSKFTTVKQLYAEQVALIAQSFAGSNSISAQNCPELTAGAKGLPSIDYSVVPEADRLKVQMVVNVAGNLLGTPYAWGGGHSDYGPTKGICESGAAANDCNIVGVDCSGLTRYAFYVAGIIVGDTAADQWQKTKQYQVPADAARVGDLVFFTGSNGSEDAPGHIGIYLGNGLMISAPQSGDVVKIESITTPFRQQELVGFTRPYPMATR